MKYINIYQQFILEEWSKNEPIKEIINKEKGLAVFLIGAPGIGKSYFIKNHIHTKNQSIKDFSTDDVSLLYTGDPNVYYKGKETPEGGRTKNASELNISKLESFIKTGQNFIYDTTGAGKEFTDKGFRHVKEIFDKAKEFNYEIVFIHLLSTLQTSLDQDKLRDRHVDPNYIKWAYAKQQGGEVDGIKIDGNIKRYKGLNPDSYYIVTSIDKKYKFYKFMDGKLAVRKNDTYVIKESLTTQRLVFFDFDDTLFHTPIKSEWMLKFGEPFKRGVDWWKSPLSLDLSLFDIKTNDWTIDKYNHSKENGDYLIMMTGRVVTLENEVRKVLESQNLEFDEYIFKPIDSVTLEYKIKTLEDKIKEFNPTEVVFYDDRRDHLPEFVKWSKSQKTDITIVDVITKKEYNNGYATKILN
jgi:predicted kinase/predicted phosphatase